MDCNPLFLTDAYKLGHAEQYPDNTTFVYSNFTPRSLSHSPIPAKFDNGKITVMGTSSVLQELVDLWNKEFFDKPKEEVVTEFLKEIQPFIGPNVFNEDRLNDLHDLGFLPIQVKALPEGTQTLPKIPHFVISNTKDEFYWLTNYLETVLSSEGWKMPTVATIASAYRRLLEYYAERTGTPSEFVDIQAHDFSSRGLSGYSDQQKTGTAHLAYFMGTDTLACLPYINAFYKGKDTFKGCSVPATEHSVMCMGKIDNELGTFKRLINDVYPNGIVSIVSDTWDFWKVITEYTVALKEDILNRGPDALGLSKVVFRPDSGDPADIICGTALPFADTALFRKHILDELPEGGTAYGVVNGTYFEGTKGKGKNWFKAIIEEVTTVTPEMKGAVECLYEIFGGTETSKGFKQLNDKVGLIYGDSITLDRADDILNRLMLKGFASGNIVLGVGSFSYQYITRDTFGFAMKATYGIVEGEGREIFKAPKTGDGTKNSAKGLLKVITNEVGEYELIDSVSTMEELSEDNELKTIFVDGFFYNLPSLEDIRANTKI